MRSCLDKSTQKPKHNNRIKGGDQLARFKLFTAIPPPHEILRLFSGPPPPPPPTLLIPVNYG